MTTFTNATGATFAVKGDAAGTLIHNAANGTLAAMVSPTDDAGTAWVVNVWAAFCKGDAAVYREEARPSGYIVRSYASRMEATVFAFRALGRLAVA